MPTKDDRGKTEKPQEPETRAVVATSKVVIAAPEAHAGEVSSRGEIEGPVGIDQIREILFGAIFRELERRLNRADMHLGARTKEIEQEARRRTEVLESHLRAEMGALATRAEQGFIEAGDALRSSSRDGREAISALEKRMSKAEEASALALRELRSQVHEQAKSFLDELQHLRKELLATLKEELEAPETGAEERGEIEEHARH
jgi:hypothetical protein